MPSQSNEFSLSQLKLFFVKDTPPVVAELQIESEVNLVPRLLPHGFRRLLHQAVVRVRRFIADYNATLHQSITPSLKVSIFLALAFSFAATGCSGPGEDESGTIGTGLIIQGTVDDSLFTQGSVIEAYSSDGWRETISINNDRSYRTDALSGQAPWLLRVKINANRDLYGIAYSDGTRNINAFSDASLRRWLAQNALDPDDVLNATDIAAILPSPLDYDESFESIADLIELVLSSYEVTGSDLISTQYITDDTGIDAFLRRNKLIIENGKITFQITDPGNNLQAVTRSPTQLDGSFVDSGLGPSQPGSVRALSGGRNDIVLIWDPSVDDVGVSGYVVQRDGALIGTTPYPQFVDENLNANQTYTYVIVALDIAGNASSPSQPVSGTSTVIVDTDDLSSPTNLREVSASDRLIRLSWDAPQDNSVATYNLYRGVQGVSLSLYQKVSETTTLDSAVTANQTYCYQVSAVSASGVESSRSEILCIDSTASTTQFDPDIVPNSWNVPDTDVRCANTLTTSDIPAGLTKLTDGCYTIAQTIEVRSGATLQIDEGVVLKFGELAKLSVVGTLTVLGSRENPVVFTGTNETPGFWGGVEFAGTNTTNNLIRGAVIQYGGSGDVSGAVSTRFNNNRFAMQDTLVQFNEGFALAFNNEELSISSFDGNLVYANELVGTVIATAVHAFDGTNRYIDNGVNEITLHGLNVVGEDIVIPDVGIPIRWPGITIVNGSLTILPGVDLRLTLGAVVDVDGPAVINGAPQRPITLRGWNTTAPGIWDGLRLHGSGNKILNHVNISDGGSSGVDTGAVEIDCTDESDVNVQIDNTDISNSASWGIYFKGGDCSLDIGNTVTFSNNGVGNSNIP